MISCWHITIVFLVVLHWPRLLVADQTVVISSLAELAEAAGKSGQQVTMKPGKYLLNEFIKLESIPTRRKENQWQFLTFRGSNNTFDLTGVTIELDTALREKLHAPIHTDEFLISGNQVTLQGLTITSQGRGVAFGGAVLGVAGQGNTLRHCTIHVEGSTPYGYGDLFGKGGYKHSGVHITGSGSRFFGCKIFQKAFGHGFYLQEDCNDVLFEDCSVEGLMRRTDEMLAEKSGLAFDRKFNSEILNRSGTPRIQAGYMKALSEDAFRTYHTHKNLSFKNCTAKNMRGAFELRTKTAPRLENCSSLGCERGFWVSTGAVLSRCQGDAQFGPLLYVEGDRAKAEVRLLPTEAKAVKVHAVAVIYGVGNEVHLTGQRLQALPIFIGYTPPSMGENASQFGERLTRGLVLRNQTSMPIVIGKKAEQCQIQTLGPVQENQGKEIQVRRLVP